MTRGGNADDNTGDSTTIVPLTNEGTDSAEDTSSSSTIDSENTQIVPVSPEDEDWTIDEIPTRDDSTTEDTSLLVAVIDAIKSVF